jgi:tetratricopeptide (TPR) repeat protein
MKGRSIGVALVFGMLPGVWLNVYAVSPNNQLQQMVEQLKSSPSDDALRERLIKHAQKLKPAPALSEEAERRMARGGVAFKSAKSTADYQEAAREFEQAIAAAPWHAAAYLNAALANDKAENYAEAARAYRFYLLAAPNAKNTKEIKALMYELEYKQERTNKEKSQRQAEQERVRRAEQALDPLKGTWMGMNCQVGSDHFGGCTEAEARGKNWHTFNGSDGPFRYNFTFPGDGTVKLNAYESWAGCKGIVWGVAKGASLQDVQWELRPEGGGTAQPVYARVANDGSWLEVSCDRPLSGANANVKYKYVHWYRPK